jgi:SAM-dependent methyltransferase
MTLRTEIVEQHTIERRCWCGTKTARSLGVFPRDPESAHAEFTLVRCEGCGVLAIFPQPSDEELTAAYSHDYYGRPGRKFIGFVSSVIGLFQGNRARQVAKSAPEGGRVLDIGCGRAGFLQRLRRLGLNVEGTERSAEVAAQAPAGIPVHVGDLLDIDLPADSYDAITIWHVFEHVRRPAETLGKIRSLLKPGGRIVIAVPNADSAQAKRYGLHWFHHDPPRHLFGFGPESLTMLLMESGFDIEKVTTHSLEQNPFGEIQSWMNAKGIPRDRLYNQLKGISSDALATRIRDLAVMAVLAVPAIVQSTMESAHGSGASLIVIGRARKREDG